MHKTGQLPDIIVRAPAAQRPRTFAHVGVAQSSPGLWFHKGLEDRIDISIYLLHIGLGIQSKVVILYMGAWVEHVHDVARLFFKGWWWWWCLLCPEAFGLKGSVKYCSIITYNVAMNSLKPLQNITGHISVMDFEQDCYGSWSDCYCDPIPRLLLSHDSAVLYIYLSIA